MQVAQRHVIKGCHQVNRYRIEAPHLGLGFRIGVAGSGRKEVGHQDVGAVRVKFFFHLSHDPGHCRFQIPDLRVTKVITYLLEAKKGQQEELGIAQGDRLFDGLGDRGVHKEVGRLKPVPPGG